MSRAVDIARHLSHLLGGEVVIQGGVRTVMSGSAARMMSPVGELYVKWGSGVNAAALRCEHAGLKALENACPGAVPALYGGVEGETFILVMSYVDSVSKSIPTEGILESSTAGPAHDSVWKSLAHMLVRVHSNRNPRYGFEEDNFIGSTPQVNTFVDTWPAFFARCRLEPQRELAQEGKRWKSAWSKPFDRLVARLEDLLPLDPGASLVHGDLWSGNVLLSKHGQPVLIDPAVYYAHFEVDLAMARLFGGFPDQFFTAYDDMTEPLPGAAERVDVYNLYHLLNHVNLFGASYAGSVDAILGRY